MYVCMYELGLKHVYTIPQVRNRCYRYVNNENLKKLFENECTQYLTHLKTENVTKVY